MTKHDSKTADELILDRFGIEWTGPKTPIAVHMDDGYWTPWHLAHAELVELRKKNAELESHNLGLTKTLVEFEQEQAIRDLERMALGIQASIDFYIKNTSSAIQGHINYGILGKVKADNPDAIPIEILERDIKALRKQAKQLKGGEK